MRIMLFRRTAIVALAAGAMMLLAPAPAHAEYACWMSDGVRYCYDPNDGQVPAEPDPAPVEEPPYTPTPPAASVEQPWVQPVPAQPAPVQPVPAPGNRVPAPLPVPINQVPVPVHVPPQPGGYHAAAGEVLAGVSEVPAEPATAVAPLSTQAPPPAEAAAAAVPTVSASSTAAASPSSSASAAATIADGRASATDQIDALPIVLAVGGVLLAAAMAWFVAPVRLALTRLVRKE